MDIYLVILLVTVFSGIALLITIDFIKQKQATKPIRQSKVRDLKPKSGIRTTGQRYTYIRHRNGKTEIWDSRHGMWYPEMIVQNDIDFNIEEYRFKADSTEISGRSTMHSISNFDNEVSNNYSASESISSISGLSSPSSSGSDFSSSSSCSSSSMGCD